MPTTMTHETPPSYRHVGTYARVKRRLCRYDNACGSDECFAVFVNLRHVQNCKMAVPRALSYWQKHFLHVHIQGGPKNRTCLSVDNSVMVTLRKACNMSKVVECCRQKGRNLHSKLFKYSLPNLPKFLLLLKLGICLHSHVPEFIELKNSLPKSPDLNSVNYLVWGHCNR